jgi:hypothetical protein
MATLGQKPTIWCDIITDTGGFTVVDNSGPQQCLFWTDVWGPDLASPPIPPVVVGEIQSLYFGFNGTLRTDDFYNKLVPVIRPLNAFTISKVGLVANVAPVELVIQDSIIVGVYRNDVKEGEAALQTNQTEITIILDPVIEVASNDRIRVAVERVGEDFAGIGLGVTLSGQ